MLPALPPWVVHNIRRSVASDMAKLGVGLPVIEKILNHVSGSFAAKFMLLLQLVLDKIVDDAPIVANRVHSRRKEKSWTDASRQR